MGEGNFRWFVGTVKDLNDPEQLGRLRLAIVNESDDPSIKTTDLLWGTPLQPIYSAASAGIGRAPVGVTIGSQVFGFYMDGQEKQLQMTKTG